MIQKRVVWTYLFVGLCILLGAALFKARMETEYCKLTGIDIPFERIFWSQANCRKRQWR